ncbi:MAG: Flp pilus assembly protein CpaB [Acidimicrobiia bacterium]
MLVVALLLAAIAGFAILQYLEGIEDEVRAGQELVDVYRAQSTIGEGTSGDLVLSQARAVLSQEQTEFLPENSITTEEALRQTLTGQVAAGPISANQVLTTDQWVPISADVTPLADIIPEGKQAITISTDATRGVNGFVRPGDRVNLIVTVDVEFVLSDFPGITFGPGVGEEEAPVEEEQQETREITVTRFVLQGLPVLAVGQDLRPEDGAREEVVVPTTLAEGQQPDKQQAPQTVFTVEVTPEQAERLVFAFETGSVWLTLVPEDFVEVDTEGITIETLFEGDLVQDLFGN